MGDDLIGLLMLMGLFMCLVVGGSYTSYRYGKHVERRALLSALTSSLSDAYYDGYRDGESRGRTKGWVDGVKECDQDELFTGRY